MLEYSPILSGMVAFGHAKEHSPVVTKVFQETLQRRTTVGLTIIQIFTMDLFSSPSAGLVTHHKGAATGNLVQETLGRIDDVHMLIENIPRKQSMQ